MATERVADDDVRQFSAEHLDAEILRLEDDFIRANDPWHKEYAKALRDIQIALGTRGDGERRPLFVDLSEVFARDYPPTQWLVTGVISRGGIAMLGAEPKSCKTWLLGEIAIAVATGTRVANEFNTEQGRVACFFAEDLAIQVRNRYRALLAARGLPPEAVYGNLFVCPRGQFIDVTRDEDVAWIVASCRMLGRIDLVALDPLRDISSAAEDKSDEMSPVMRRLRLIGELLSCTVAVAHHAGKPTADNQKRRPGQRMRGSSAIYGSTDSGIYFGLRDGGDNVSRFEIEVDVEIKGARSAGNLMLTLDVEDDAYGSAMKATWNYSKSANKKRKSVNVQMDDADTIAFDFIRELAIQGTYVSTRALRDHDSNPLGDHALRDAVERLVRTGRLVKDGTIIRIPNPPQTGAQI